MKPKSFSLLTCSGLAALVVAILAPNGSAPFNWPIWANIAFTAGHLILLVALVWGGCSVLCYVYYGDKT